MCMCVHMHTFDNFASRRSLSVDVYKLMHEDTCKCICFEMKKILIEEI